MEELTTEQKIIQAANEIFARKGYSATTIREIAEQAGTNPALLNYYFGSKENLFVNVVTEKLKLLLSAIDPILSDEHISLEEKILSITESYTNLLLENEELLIFILNELSVNKELFADPLQNAREIAQPVIEKQLREMGIDMSLPNLIINMFGLIMFPFLVKPLIVSSGLLNEEEFSGFVTSRKEKILEWIMKQIK